MAPIRETRAPRRYTLDVPVGAAALLPYTTDPTSLILYFFFFNREMVVEQRNLISICSVTEYTPVITLSHNCGTIS